ncbi:sugar transferase [Microbacterium hominis]|uniref:sugar transferase n=1 Tax=Microbacterium hominis TaxID=162426 RepID=UPI0020B8CC30|nr:sugar transferase [Microbacterium hominis]
MTSNALLDAPTTPLTDTPPHAPRSAAAHQNAAKTAHAASTAPTLRIAPRATIDWRRAFSTRLVITDALVVIWTVFGTQMLWFGWGNAQITMRNNPVFTPTSYWLFSTLLVVAWLTALALIDSRSHRVIGQGMAEYIRVTHSSVVMFGVVAIIAFLAKIDIARSYLLIALPLGITMLLLSRWIWRNWLVAKRSVGEYSARVLLVGSEASVTHIATELLRSPSAGYHVVGACIPTGMVADTIAGTGIPIMGNVDAVDRAIAVTGADTVAVTSTDELPADKVKQISWGLEAGRQHLVLAPSITDIAGPRIHTRPVSGLPLIHVETPTFSRGQRFAKRTTDLVVSTLGLIVISPVLIVLALLVKFSSPGPVIFRQTRVGRRGEEFTMLKFRSMVVDAEARLSSLETQVRDAGNEVLFKMKRDPRITPIGRVLRKYSLDELPQLFNVMGGSMSLVGPRPSLPSEVAKYADHVHRRFLVKPGITGLWQVSGRSALSWEESVRLDLSYVENWSLIGDVGILAKTAKAALAPGETAH